MLHLLRWNINAAIKNLGELDIGHVSIPRVREARRWASKLGLQDTIQKVNLPPEDYMPPEQFCAGWDPEMLKDESATIESVQEHDTLLDEVLGSFLDDEEDAPPSGDPSAVGAASKVQPQAQSVHMQVGAHVSDVAAKPLPRQRARVSSCPYMSKHDNILVSSILDDNDMFYVFHIEQDAAGASTSGAAGLVVPNPHASGNKPSQVAPLLPLYIAI